MNAKIYNKETYFQVFFNGNWFSLKSEKEAKEKAFELNFEYFKENKDKLPRGIRIDVADKRFRFFIRVNDNTVKYIKSSKDLQHLIDIRKYVILNLLELF
jgi:hypothetical protein